MTKARSYQWEGDQAVKESDWSILDATDREFVQSPSKVFFFI